jgi:hypothetical protein
LAYILHQVNRYETVCITSIKIQIWVCLPDKFLVTLQEQYTYKMKKTLILFCLLVIFNLHKTLAQSWQWAYTEGTAPRSTPVAIKQDHNGELYTAYFTDSISTTVSTQMNKRDANQQLLWQILFHGNVHISDAEIDAANQAIVVGYFMGNVAFGDTLLSSYSPVDNSGFILRTDTAGHIEWVKAINPVNGNFEPNDMYIAANGQIYLTSAVSGSYGFCAFHKLDAQGNILMNEFNNNFDNRTFSHILTDNAGNIYLSGTCGNQAMFDTIHADANFSYQNFLVKYNDLFEAQWLITRNYITFDDNNSLSSDGHSLYWAFNEFISNLDSIKIIKFDFNGQNITATSGPLGSAFFPAFNFMADSNGKSVLLVNVYSSIYLYGYDNTLSISWMDTLQNHISGFPYTPLLSCYDSVFYISSVYLADTLSVGSFLLLNPNSGANFPSDIFTAQWGYQSAVAINEHTKYNHSIVVYPNPANDILKIESIIEPGTETLKILNSQGKLIYYKTISSSLTTINISDFPGGLYFIQLEDEANEVSNMTKFLVIK